MLSRFFDNNWNHDCWYIDKRVICYVIDECWQIDEKWLKCSKINFVKKKRVFLSISRSMIRKATRIISNWFWWIFIKLSNILTSIIFDKMFFDFEISFWRYLSKKKMFDTNVRSSKKFFFVVEKIEFLSDSKLSTNWFVMIDNIWFSSNLMINVHCFVASEKLRKIFANVANDNLNTRFNCCNANYSITLSKFCWKTLTKIIDCENWMLLLLLTIIRNFLIERDICDDIVMKFDSFMIWRIWFACW